MELRYTVKRKNGHIFSRIFTIEEIEHGEVVFWIQTNNIIESDLIREQYTEKKDKNGKKIFVGDQAIITYEYITRAVDITFKDCSFWITDNGITNFDCWLESKGITSIEIIGNIHEPKDH